MKLINNNESKYSTDFLLKKGLKILKYITISIALGLTIQALFLEPVARGVFTYVHDWKILVLASRALFGLGSLAWADTSYIMSMITEALARSFAIGLIPLSIVGIFKLMYKYY